MMSVNESEAHDNNKQSARSGSTKKLEIFGLSYGFVRVISIVETILDLFSPSLGGISAVPIATFVTVRSFRKRLLVISAQSTAVVIACPLAFRVISLPSPEENAVIMAST